MIQKYDTKSKKEEKMRKFFGVILFMVLFSGVSTLQAEEYLVRQGDNLTSISEFTGYSVNKLAQMSNIENPDLILVGQKITYISKDDMVDSYLWCEQRISELQEGLITTYKWMGFTDRWIELDKNIKYFLMAKEDITVRNFRYSFDDPSGIHFDLILKFAEAQRRAQSLRGVYIWSYSNIWSYSK